MSDLTLVALMLSIFGVGHVFNGQVLKHFGERDAGLIEVVAACAIMFFTHGEGLPWTILSLVVCIASLVLMRAKEEES